MIFILKMEEIFNPDININFDGNNIWLKSNKSFRISSLDIKIKGAQTYLYDEHLDIDKTINYWFLPENKIYKYNPFYFEVFENDQIILRKKFNEKLGFKLNRLIPNLGIGDLFICYSYVKKYYDEYDIFYITIDYGIITKFRNDSDIIKKFTRDLIFKIFDDPKIIISEYDLNDNYDDFVKQNVLRGIVQSEPILYVPNMEHIIKNLKYFDYDIEIPYCILHTKIRSESYNQYLDYKDEFFKIINLLSNKYKIMLIGERKIEENPEYDNENKYSKLSSFLIYDDILNNVDKKNIIDLTVDELLHNNNIDNFLNGCYLINKSIFSIFWGGGGPSFFMLPFAKKTIGFRTCCGNTINDNFIMSRYINKDNIFLTNDIDEFLNELKKLI